MLRQYLVNESSVPQGQISHAKENYFQFLKTVGQEAMTYR